MRTTSTSRWTFLAYFVISITAKAKNIGKTIPTASSFFTSFVFDKDSIENTVIIPKSAAPKLGKLS